jgi:hypothetical protein
MEKDTVKRRTKRPPCGGLLEIRVPHIRGEEHRSTLVSFNLFCALSTPELSLHHTISLPLPVKTTSTAPERGDGRRPATTDRSR